MQVPQTSKIKKTKALQDTYEEVEMLSKKEENTISLVRRLSDNCYFICKSIKMTDMNTKERDDVNNEIALMQSMRHPNIVKLYEVVQDNECVHCIQQYCEEGDLQHHIKRQSKKGEFFSQNIVESWALQVLLALEYIHNIKVVHRDIKASNIFLTSTGNIKVGSFKLSRALKEDRFATTFAGTPSHMSPEILEGKQYDSKTDIWSLGCLIFELCALRPAFASPNLLQLASKIIRGEPDCSIPSHYTKSLSDVIKKCFTKKPADRPSAKELLRTQYFLNVMQRFINKSGLVSEQEQRIPIKKIGIHKKLADKKSQKTPVVGGGLNKKKVPTSQIGLESQSDKKPSARKSVEKKVPVTPTIEAKSELKKSAKNLHRSNSQDRKRSLERLKTPSGELPVVNTPLGKVEGKKMPLPTIPKPSVKKNSQLARSHDISKELEEVSRSVNSQIQSPSKDYDAEPSKENEQKDIGHQNWIDNEDIDYSISMTKKNLAVELQNFRKNRPHLEEGDLPSGKPFESRIFDSLLVRQDDDAEPESLCEGELDANRLTANGDELPQLLTQYKSKMEEVIQQLNYRYGPNMEIIAERTNEFGSDEFSKQKPLDTSES